MAERVLGNVISSGIKVLVLAVIVGIGSTLFSQFTTGMAGTQPPIHRALAAGLAAPPPLGPWLFGPGIAHWLLSRGPPLRARRARGPAPPGGRGPPAGVAR